MLLVITGIFALHLGSAPAIAAADHRSDTSTSDTAHAHATGVAQDALDVHHCCGSDGDGHEIATCALPRPTTASPIADLTETARSEPGPETPRPGGARSEHPPPDLDHLSISRT